MGRRNARVHSGEWKHGLNAPVTTPIVRTSNFNFASTAELKRFAEGKSKAYLYTRYGNPTLAVARRKLRIWKRRSGAGDGFRDGGDLERFAGGAEIGG